MHSVLSPPVVVREHGVEYRLYSTSSPVVPERPTFVLVHGIGMSHRYLQRLAAALAPHGHVCAIELPGFGANATPAHLVGPVVDPTGRSVWHQVLGLAADSMVESPSANAIVFTDYWRCGPRWYLASLPAMFGYPIEQRIRLVEQPVLVLRGSRDPVARADWCRGLAGLARNGRFSEIAGQAHAVLHGAADEVAAMILAFLATPVGRGA